MNSGTVWSKLIALQSQDVIDSLSIMYNNVKLDMDIRVELAPWLEDTLVYVKRILKLIFKFLYFFNLKLGQIM